jgi:hypothetical protein
MSGMWMAAFLTPYSHFATISAIMASKEASHGAHAAEGFMQRREGKVFSSAVGFGVAGAVAEGLGILLSKTWLIALGAITWPIAAAVAVGAAVTGFLRRKKHASH